jgi:hypothetical protein
LGELLAELPAQHVAGLWKSFRWRGETVMRSFTILTTTPNAEMAELHDRAPAPRQLWDSNYFPAQKPRIL